MKTKAEIMLLQKRTRRLVRNIKALWSCRETTTATRIMQWGGGEKFELSD
jgi:hypothetical protein